MQPCPEGFENCLCALATRARPISLSLRQPKRDLKRGEAMLGYHGFYPIEQVQLCRPLLDELISGIEKLLIHRSSPPFVVHLKSIGVDAGLSHPDVLSPNYLLGFVDSFSRMIVGTRIFEGSDDVLASLGNALSANLSERNSSHE